MSSGMIALFAVVATIALAILVGIGYSIWHNANEGNKNQEDTEKDAPFVVEDSESDEG